MIAIETTINQSSNDEDKSNDRSIIILIFIGSTVEFICVWWILIFVYSMVTLEPQIPM